MVVSTIIVLAIPLWVVVRGADFIFLSLAGLAYLTYVCMLVAMVTTGDDEDRLQHRKDWRTLLEPLLCLPNAPHLFRRLSERNLPIVPLVDVLQSQLCVRERDLRCMLTHLGEWRDVTDDVDRLAFIEQLDRLVIARLTKAQL